MFEFLDHSRRASALPAGSGALVSAAVHAAIIGAFALDLTNSPTNDATTWEEMPEGLTYWAPPDVNSRASTVQISYQESGGGNGEADPQEKIAEDAPEARGHGPGENAQASVSGDEADQIATPTEDPYEDAFSSVEVESMAERDPLSAAPAYPPELMVKGVEGFAAMRFVVDTTGHVDMNTVRVLETTHAEFAQAVQDAMPKMRFSPARLGDRPVRQLAEQLFAFQIQRSVSDLVTGSSAPTDTTAQRNIGPDIPAAARLLRR